MIATQDQTTLAQWLCSRIGLVPTPDLRCVGVVTNGHLKGVVGYDGYNGASIMIHSAGEGNWVTRDMLWATFDFPFNVCKVNMIIGLVPSGNEQAVKFNRHLGFKIEHVLKGAHPDGSLIVMTMQRSECKYLERKHHGQKEPAASGA